MSGRVKTSRNKQTTEHSLELWAEFFLFLSDFYGSLPPRDSPWFPDRAARLTDACRSLKADRHHGASDLPFVSCFNANTKETEAVGPCSSWQGNTDNTPTEPRIQELRCSAQEKETHRWARLSRAAQESPPSALSSAALTRCPARRRKVGVPGSARAGKGRRGGRGRGRLRGGGAFSGRGAPCSCGSRVGPVCRSVPRRTDTAILFRVFHPQLFV